MNRMWNPFANMATLAGNEITIVGGNGSTVVDSQGRSYLDALASLWYCNVGYGRTELAEAAAAQMRELAAYHTFEFFSNQPGRGAVRADRRDSPGADARVFLTPGGGSDAIDTAGKPPGLTGARSASRASRSSSPGRTPTTA